MKFTVLPQPTMLPHAPIYAVSHAEMLIGFEVLKTVTMKIVTFWDVTL
jgi:hypothetical protein